MNKKCVVDKTIFENFHSSLNGGVFCVDSVNFDIKCCIFTNNSCIRYGACFYCTKTSLILKKTSFYLCWCQAKAGDVFGNVGYLSENNAYTENVCVRLCGKNANDCSDSALYFEKGIIQLFLLNASTNYGFEGSASFTARYADVASIARYINVLDGKDESMMQFAYKPFRVEYANLINCLDCSRVIILSNSEAQITLVNCIIWNTGNKDILYPLDKFTSIGTYCDRNYPPLSSTASCSTYHIFINIKCQTNEIQQCNNYIYLNYQFLFALIIII